MAAVTVLDLETPHGPARAHLHPADRPRAALVLGHGAGGGVGAPDLVATTEVALSEQVTVALVEQPYRVAGRKAPAPAGQLDTCWVAVVEQLLGGELEGLALIVGGRSLGARVACRTVEATGGVAVLCLAFPFVPPRRKGGGAPQSRLAELEAVSLPVLIVQGRAISSVCRLRGLAARWCRCRATTACARTPRPWHAPCGTGCRAQLPDA